MSEPIPLIGSLTSSGQPLISGLAFGPAGGTQERAGQQQANQEAVIVEVHETVQLVRLAEEEEDEDDIDLRMEEMDSRLDTIEEQLEETTAAAAEEEEAQKKEPQHVEEERAGGIAEENKEKEEETEEAILPEKARIETTEEVSTEVLEHEEEGKRKEEEEVVAEERRITPQKSVEKEEEEQEEVPRRKITAEEDLAMQQLLKDLDEAEAEKPPAAAAENEQQIVRTVVEVNRVEEVFRQELPADELTTKTTMQQENTVTTVTLHNNGHQQSRNTFIEATILEDNNAAAEPIATVEAAATTAKVAAQMEEQREKQGEEAPQEQPQQSHHAHQQQQQLHEFSPQNGLPVLVRMRPKPPVEKQQAIVAEEPADQALAATAVDQLIIADSKLGAQDDDVKATAEEPSTEQRTTTTTTTVWRREEATTVEPNAEKPVERPVAEKPVEKCEQQQPASNGIAERVEEVELRRAVEELQTVQLRPAAEEVRQPPPPSHRQIEDGGILVEKKTVVERQLEIHRTEPPPPPPMANGHATANNNINRNNNIRTNFFLEQHKENAVPSRRPIQIQLQPQQHLLEAKTATTTTTTTTAMTGSTVSPASNASSSTTPYQQQQNGGGTLSRGPGARSPFGQLEMLDEDWRLSPKTLSRIKRLKVVMEPATAMDATTGLDRNGEEAKEAGDVIHHHPIFVKDTSRFWYKPTISREEAISMLKNKPPGTFVVRDSNSFPGAFGLALKVAQPPAGVTTNDGSELVRHFLIEPSAKGVRLKGCSNEPVFGTLAALVYQHSITPLALPCRLILPEFDPASSPEHLNTNQALLERGAACNVTFLCSVDTESLTGPEAVRRSAAFAFELLQRRELRAVPVHFKVSSQGITLTDNTRSLFFRRHYPVNSVTFAGIDPESRAFDNNSVSQLPPTYVRQAPVFGFVARKNLANGYNGGGTVENACHIFAELDPDQPASAVVRFISNVMMPTGRAQLQQIHQNANQMNSH